MVPARYSPRAYAWGSAGRDLEQRNQKGWCQFLSQCLPICEEEKSVREWPAYLLVLPKVIPVNVQKTAEMWPFWVKPHSDSHPHAPLLFPTHPPGEEVAGVSSLSEMVPARYSPRAYAWGSAGRDLEQRNQKGWCQFLSQCLPICEEEKSVREWPAYLYIYVY